METSIVVAGFGGQGVLFAGQLLAYAALAAGKEVTWIPSYGPEMRGGTAHCTVVVSDELIGSPLVRYPDFVIAMNQPSAQKYAGQIAQDGHLLINASLVTPNSISSNATIHWIAANQIAQEAGTEKAANVVMLGALLAIEPVLSLSALADAIASHLPQRHRALLDANLHALAAGAALSERITEQGI